MTDLLDLRGLSLEGRLRLARGSRTQRDFAKLMGVALPTYQNYERGLRVPDASALAPIAREGWNANWLLTGEGPERLGATFDKGLQPSGSVEAGVSHTMNLDVLRMAVGLADQLLGRTTPPDYAEIVSLIHDLVLEGLPEAQIVSIAGRQASSRRVAGGTGSSQGSAAAPASAAEASRKASS
jgi:transcriptional regulator with XRE-family HTH domain